MSTTAIIVEVLIIGIQCGMTILLWAMGLLGYGVIHKPLSLLDAHGGSASWMPLIGVVFLAACYTLGVLVDRIVMLLFYRVRSSCPGFFRWLGRKVKEPCQRDEAFIKILPTEGQLSSFLQDERSRLRIARATVFHLVLICAAWFTPHLKSILPRSGPSLLFVEILGIGFLVAAFFGWAILLATYEERLEQVEKLKR